LSAALFGAIAPDYARAQPGFMPFFQKQHQGPVNVTGNNFVYDYKTDSFVVTGDAVVTQRNTVLRADRINLLRRNRMFHATGNVHLADPLGNITATDANVNMADETADLTNAKITNTQRTYRLEGARVIKLTGQRYSVLDGFFTTCGCDTGTPDWSITGDEMNVHMGSQGTAQHAHFNVLGYPLIYFPWAVFPADSTRHSGLLGPRIGESGLRGLQIVQPYFWAINKSSDASAALDVETAQRVGLLGEYRLIAGPDDYFTVDGAFYNEDLRSAANRATDIIDTQIADPHIPVDRYDIIGMARQHITSDLVVYGDGLSVSDPLELREMNVWTLSRTIGAGVIYPNALQTLRVATSDFGALDSYENGFAQLQGIWNQDLIQPQKFALQTLPELLLSGRKELLGGLLYADYDFRGDDFWRSAGQDGLRLDMFPRVTMPWRLGDYLYGWGTLGVRETLYDVSGHQVDIIPVGTSGRLFNNALTLGPLAPGGFHSREMIYGSAGVASELERIYNLNWKTIAKIKNTIEPFAFYSYVPNIDQSDLPLFDQVDRIEPRSLITYGVTSRIYAKLPPAAAQQAEGPPDLTEGEQTSAVNPFGARIFSNGGAVDQLLVVKLMQAYDTDHAIAIGGTRFSDLDLTATVFPTNIWSMGGQLGYSPQQAEVSYASLFLNFQPWWLNNKPKLYMGRAEAGSFLQVSYNYIGPGPQAQPGINANFSQFLILRAYYDLFDRLGVYYAPAYDFAHREFLSQEYGFRIKSPCDCWAFDMGISKTINPSETQFQFQLTLGGLGSIGQSPFGRNPFQLHTSVLPGYY
jgi:LPS-assembly protein